MLGNELDAVRLLRGVTDDILTISSTFALLWQMPSSMLLSHDLSSEMLKPTTEGPYLFHITARAAHSRWEQDTDGETQVAPAGSPWMPGLDQQRVTCDLTDLHSGSKLPTRESTCSPQRDVHALPWWFGYAGVRKRTSGCRQRQERRQSWPRCTAHGVS